MGSVGVAWRGSALPAQQDELLGFLERLVAANDELLKEYPPPADEFWFAQSFRTASRMSCWAPVSS